MTKARRRIVASRLTRFIRPRGAAERLTVGADIGESMFLSSSFLRAWSFGFRHSFQRLIQHARLLPAARLPPPAKPAARVTPGPDFALFTAINHPHGDKLDRLSGGDELAEQFRFNLEMVGADM